MSEKKTTKFYKLPEEILDDVKRYNQLRKRKKKIESEMEDLKSNICRYVMQDFDSDQIEDRHWVVSCDPVKRSFINKGLFVSIYGEDKVSEVSSTSTYIKCTVRHK